MCFYLVSYLVKDRLQEATCPKNPAQYQKKVFGVPYVYNPRITEYVSPRLLNEIPDSLLDTDIALELCIILLIRVLLRVLGNGKGRRKQTL